MHVAHELSKLLPAENDPAIALMDRNNFLLFTPMLTEVAGGELDARHIVAAPHRLSGRIRFEQAAIEHIDLSSKSVTFRPQPDGDGTKTLTADQLVIALGSVSNYHHIDGLEQHSLGIKSISDAVAIRNRVLGCLQRASIETDPVMRRQLLTFVVGGGGYTGVETMAAINDLARTTASGYANVKPDDITTIIVEPGDRILAEISPDLARYARQKLEERGIKILLKTKIVSATENEVRVDPGSPLQCRTLIWAGGVKPNPLVDQLTCNKGHHGGIAVSPSCAVPGFPGVWALGDCAEVPQPTSKGSYAPTAQNATREGELVAQNIVSVLRGGKPQPFTFQPIGELALVGRHSGVAKLYGRHFSGLLAWAMWRAIYLSKMPGVAKRSRIALDWILDAIFGRETAAVPPERTLAPSSR